MLNILVVFVVMMVILVMVVIMYVKVFFFKVVVVLVFMEDIGTIWVPLISVVIHVARIDLVRVAGVAVLFQQPPGPFPYEFVQPAVEDAFFEVCALVKVEEKNLDSVCCFSFMS